MTQDLDKSAVAGRLTPIGLLTCARSSSSRLNRSLIVSAHLSRLTVVLRLGLSMIGLVVVLFGEMSGTKAIIIGRAR